MGLKDADNALEMEQEGDMQGVLAKLFRERVLVAYKYAYQETQEEKYQETVERLEAEIEEIE